MPLSSKKITVLSGLTGFVLLGLLAAKPFEEEKPVYKNLKVLLKISVMMTWIM